MTLWSLRIAIIPDTMKIMLHMTMANFLQNGLPQPTQDVGTTLLRLIDVVSTFLQRRSNVVCQLG